ncbi:MAG: hypothetical protein IJF02_04430 [Oscillospiraceae bacterium]|nr:hypothetical protein [Oscillospiraceae bacterium]
MKKQLLTLSAIQIICNILYILTTNAYYAVFTLQNFWTSFLMYTAGAVSLLEIGIILLVIIYVGANITSFWKMLGIITLYLAAVDAIEFVLQFGIDLYGFVPQSFLYTSLIYMVIFLAFACLYFLFQKFVLQKTVS